MARIDLSELIDKQLDPDAVHQDPRFIEEATGLNPPKDEGDSGSDAVPSGKDDA